MHVSFIISKQFHVHHFPSFFLVIITVRLIVLPLYCKYIQTSKKTTKRRRRKIAICSLQATFHANNNNILTIFFCLGWFASLFFCFAHFTVYGFILRHGHRWRGIQKYAEEKKKTMFQENQTNK